ncbi:MAG: TonB-dependent receptor [Chitinophagales bacterium]
MNCSTIPALLILLLFVSPFSKSYSQSNEKIQITGKIIDGGTDSPLEYASISAYSINDSTIIGGGISNEKGDFSIDAKSAPFYLEIRFLGYLSKNTKAFSPGENQKRVNAGEIILNEDSESLEEVEVIGEKSQMQLKLDKRIFNVGKDLSNTGANAVEILDNIPSVEVDQEGGVSLRGSENVRILIDGKPSAMLGMSGSDALLLLQGDMIERVEVVTNPSSRYEAEGDVGIINIILKKNKKQGINGAVTATTGFPHNHSLGVNLNYRKGKFNLFGGYSVNYRKSPGTGYLYQEVYNANTTEISEQIRDRTRGGLGNTFQFGTDFYLNDKNTLTVSGTIRPAGRNNETNLRYLDFNEAGDLVQEVTRDDNETETKRDYEANLNYVKTFKKEEQKFTFDAQWSISNDLEESDVIEKNLNTGSETEQRVSNLEGGQNWLFQSDYVQPFAKNGKFETGVRTTIRTVNNDYKVEQFNNGEWQVFGGFQDDFTYQENIFAAYAMAGNKNGKLSYQGGIRAEYTDITLSSESDASTNKKQYLNWFPSAHLSYEFNDKNSLQLSYSYRVSRPHYRSLLPFSNYSDSRNFYRGNPDLDPTFTNSIEMGYLKYWETGSFFSSLYYRYSTGAVDRVVFVDSTGNSVRFPINLSTESSGGYEATVSQNIFKWWKFNFNVNLFWFTRDGEYEGQSFEASTFRWTFRLNSQWKLPKDFNAQANWRFRSPYTDTQSDLLALNVLDLSISKDFLKKKATLTFSVQDVFNSRKWRGVIDNEDFYREYEYQWRVRQYLLSFTYRINQNPNKKSGGRPDGDDMMDF